MRHWVSPGRRLRHRGESERFVFSHTISPAQSDIGCDRFEVQLAGHGAYLCRGIRCTPDGVGRGGMCVCINLVLVEHQSPAQSETALCRVEVQYAQGGEESQVEFVSNSVLGRIVLVFESVGFAPDVGLGS